MTYQEWLGFMQQYLQSVEKYSSIYSGQQIDTAVGKALNPDTTPTANSTALITSGGVKSALTGVGDNTGVRLSSGDDLNTIIKAGFYSWYGGSASTRPSNLPSLDGVTQNYCSMIVSPMSTRGVMQMVFTHGTYKKIARRFLDGSTWGDWEELVTKSALDMFYIGSAYVDATANTDATIEITAPSGYTKGVFIGLYAGSSWGDITKCIVVSQGTDYPNRIKVCSTSAQRINAKILWIK